MKTRRWLLGSLVPATAVLATSCGSEPERDAAAGGLSAEPTSTAAPGAPHAPPTPPLVDASLASLDATAEADGGLVCGERGARAVDVKLGAATLSAFFSISVPVPLDVGVYEVVSARIQWPGWNGMRDALIGKLRGRIVLGVDRYTMDLEVTPPDAFVTGADGETLRLSAVLQAMQRFPVRSAGKLTRPAPSLPAGSVWPGAKWGCFDLPDQPHTLTCYWTMTLEPDCPSPQAATRFELYGTGDGTSPFTPDFCFRAWHGGPGPPDGQNKYEICFKKVP